MAIAPFRRQPPSTTAEWERFLREANVTSKDITNDKLRDSEGLSVIGRSLPVAGEPGDIVAAANGEFLRVRSNLLQFGAIVEDEIPVEIKRRYTVVEITSDGSLATNTANFVTANSLITLTLPTGSEGDQLVIKKSNGYYDVVINGGIDSYSSITLKYTGSVIVLLHDGTGWNIISHNGPFYPVANGALSITIPSISGTATTYKASSGSLSVSSPSMAGTATKV